MAQAGERYRRMHNLMSLEKKRKSSRRSEPLIRDHIDKHKQPIVLQSCNLDQFCHWQHPCFFIVALGLGSLWDEAGRGGGGEGTPDFSYGNAVKLYEREGTSKAIKCYKLNSLRT